MVTLRVKLKTYIKVCSKYKALIQHWYINVLMTINDIDIKCNIFAI